MHSCDTCAFRNNPGATTGPGSHLRAGDAVGRPGRPAAGRGAANKAAPAVFVRASTLMAAAGAPAAGASGAGGGRPKLLQGKPQPAAYAPPPPGFLGAVTAPIGKASARAASLQAARIKLAARLAAEARKERACVDLYRGAGRDDMMDQDGDGCYD